MHNATIAVLGVVWSLMFGTWYVCIRSSGMHCDTLDGPVASEAKAALEKGDVTPVLKWVKQEHEGEIKVVFAQALVVRAGGDEAKTLADTHFIETLVRLHHAGEGEPYTGLKPAGPVDPTVLAADKALEKGSVEELASDLAQSAAQGIRERFAALIEAAKHKDRSVDDGRRYVEAYVAYVHYIERLHGSIAAGDPHPQHGGHEYGQASETHEH